MKSILRATAILGSSSIVSILVGLVSSKAYALLLGPVGLGYMGLLQSLVGLVGIVAGMGIGTGVVRTGAAALAQGEGRQLAALLRGAWLIVCAFGLLSIVVMALFQEPISRLMLGGPEHGGSVVLMGVTVFFSLASGLQTSILAAHHRVGALARVSIFSSILVTLVSVLLVWWRREDGVALAIIAGSAVSWAVSQCFLRRAIVPPEVKPTRPEVLDAARSLLRFGAPYTASIIVGTGVQLLLPTLVLHTLGAESVGFYRAAIGISVTYLAFLLNAMAQDYYPRISAAGSQPATLVDLVNQQHRLVMLVGVPLILGALALAPYIVPLIYSPRFSPAVNILEWQLIGDIFKFSSWTMAFIILVRSGSTVFFFTELMGGLAILLSTWLGVQLFGLAGVGVGFLAGYIIYYFVVWFVVRREIPLVWTTENKAMIIGALLAASLIRSLPFVGLETLRTPVALLLALLASAGAAYIIWKEVGGLRGLKGLRGAHARQ